LHAVLHQQLDARAVLVERGLRFVADDGILEALQNDVDFGRRELEVFDLLAEHEADRIQRLVVIGRESAGLRSRRIGGGRGRGRIGWRARDEREQREWS
jgi:hypothetical protein